MIGSVQKAVHLEVTAKTTIFMPLDRNTKGHQDSNVLFLLVFYRQKPVSKEGRAMNYVHLVPLA